MTHIPFLENRVALVNIMWTMILGFLGLYVIDHYHKKAYFFLYSYLIFHLIFMVLVSFWHLGLYEIVFITLTILYSLLPLV